MLFDGVPSVGVWVREEGLGIGINIFFRGCRGDGSDDDFDFLGWDGLVSFGG